MRMPIVAAALALISFPSLGSSASQTQSAKVLFLGDSFSIGTFGRTLDTRMRETGLDVFTVVAGGASPYYWLGSYQSLPCTIGFWQKTPAEEKRLGYVKAVPKIEDLLAEVRPDIVVVQTGVNLYATLRSKRRPKEDNVTEVRHLIDQMCFAIAKRGAKSYWVLPPHSHEDRYPQELQDELSELMKDVVRDYNGAVFESQKFTRFTDPYPSTDGIHYGPEDARVWAERVAADFQVYLRINGSYASRIPDRPAPAAELASASQASYAHASPRPVPPLPAGMSSRASSRGQASPPPSPDAAPSGPATAVAAYSGEAVSSGDAAPALPTGPDDVIAQAPEVVLNLRLLEKSELQNLADVPYSHALGVYEYEVIDDKLGNYPLKKIRVAHGIVFNRKFTSIARQSPGDTIALRLVPLSAYRSLQTWQTVDDLRPNFELPLYTPKLN